MYSTCLFCHASLGRNEAIEHFPVGRRLAFDAAKGRLWVVCRACERWNLTPLEERWEAIEQCERDFRGAKLRVSTEHVGLARLREGTTLIRIGAPQRPELAAWRYGDQFGRRRRWHLGVTAAAVTGAAALYFAGPFGMASLNLSLALDASSALSILNLGLNHTRFRGRLGGANVKVRLEVNGQRYAVRRDAVSSASFRPHGTYDFEIAVRLGKPWWRDAGRPDALICRGDDALRIAHQVLPHVNAHGAKAASVQAAVALIEDTPTASQLFARLAAGRPRYAGLTRRQRAAVPMYSLSYMPVEQRLAMEMALHEEDERRALEGELSLLEDRWKEAEEIAAISDGMLS